MIKYLLCFLLLVGAILFGEEDQIEHALHTAIQNTKDQQKLSELYKALRDYYASSGKMKEANEANEKLQKIEEKESLKSQIEGIQKLGREKHFDEAIDKLYILLKKHPKSIEARLLLARYLGWTMHFSEAEFEVDKVLASDPENLNALLIKANLLRWQRQTENAITIYNKILLAHEDFNARLGLAWAYLDAKQIPDARLHFQFLHPSNPAEESDYQALAAQLENAKKISPDLGEVKKLAAEQKYEEAIKELRRITEKYPDLTEAHLLLSLYLGWTKNYAEADKEIDKVLAVDSKNPKALLIKADILRWQRYLGEAIKTYSTLLYQNEDFYARLGLAWAYLNLEQLAEAQLNFQLLAPDGASQQRDYQELGSAIESFILRAIQNETDPNKIVELYRALIALYSFEGKTKEAKDASIAMKAPEAKKEAATLVEIRKLGEEKRFEEAIQRLQAITKKYPNLSEAHLLLALYLGWTKNYSEGEIEIDKVLAVEPENTEALLIKANLLRWQQRFEEAIKIYAHLLELKEDFNTRLGLAWTFLELGHVDEAKINFQMLTPTTPSEETDYNQLSSLLKNAQVEVTAKCEEIQQEISSTKKNADLSLLYKRLGDCFARQEKESEAKEAYLKALSLPYGVLTISQRLDAANYLGTHESIDPAIAEVEKVLADDPKNLQAKILLARFLSWNKKFPEALREVDVILAQDPNNQEALLIKANTLRWSEKTQEAVPIYEALLAHEESYDARSGLTWAYVRLEQFEKADANFALLTPTLAYQIKEKQELAQAIEKEKVEAPKRKIQTEIDQAIKLAGDKKFNEAHLQIYNLLCENPCNQDVQIALSKILAWSGRYRESLQLLREILWDDPRNVEALVVKANVLRWKASAASIWAYQDVLCVDPENFYAQLGLSYALTARSWVNSALRIMCCIDPKEDYQKKDLNDLKDAIRFGPAFNFAFYRYTDSQEIDTIKYFATGTHWINDWQIDIIYRHLHNTQPTIVPDHPILEQKSDKGEADVFRSINPYLDLAGGIGYATIRGEENGHFIVGNLRANVFTPCGNFSLGSVYDLYEETAAALFFKIRTWTNYITYINFLSGQTTVGGSYFYTKFSDANHSNRGSLFIQQQLYNKNCWQATVKYDVIYWTFASQPFSIFAIPSLLSGGHGYFDPQHWISNQLTWTNTITKKNLYANIYPYLGYVSFHLIGVHYHGPYYGIGGLLGLKFSRNVLVEVTSEVSDYRLKHLDYTYVVFAGRLRCAF